MCSRKVVHKKMTEEQLELKKSIDWLATENGVRWYGHVLRRDDDTVLTVARDLEVSGKKKAMITEEDMEAASGGGDREDWFEGTCLESSKVENWSVSN